MVFILDWYVVKFTVNSEIFARVYFREIKILAKISEFTVLARLWCSAEILTTRGYDLDLLNHIRISAQKKTYFAACEQQRRRSSCTYFSRAICIA